MLTLVSIGLERYYAICHPLREQSGGRFTATNILIPSVWLIAALSALPFIFIYKLSVSHFLFNIALHKFFGPPMITVFK